MRRGVSGEQWIPYFVGESVQHGCALVRHDRADANYENDDFSEV